MTPPARLLRALGLGDAMLLVIGCIVGVGIFRTPGTIAAHVSSPALILMLWLIGGLLSLCGGLCYAELAAMFPKTGGDYVYITRIYGTFWGFVFGWTKLFVERTGTIAILGVVFAEYLGGVLGYGATTLRWMATGAILLLTAVNVRGVRWGAATQNILTVLKIGALGAIIVVGLSAHRGQAGAWTAPMLPLSQPSTWQALGVSLVFVLWTYGGWTEAAYVAEELRNPQRDIPRAMIGGLLLTTTLYLAVNAIYLWYVPLQTMATTKLVASTMMQQAVGRLGAVGISAMIACSAFGALNGYILTGARILYALGRDHALFAKLGGLHPRFQTPSLALWLNAAVAALLIWTKTFDQIAIYSTVVISVFFLLTVVGVIILRRTQPKTPRPYRTWGYPVTPLLYTLVILAFIADVCVKQPTEALFGFGLMALAIPLYALSRALASPAQKAG